MTLTKRYTGNTPGVQDCTHKQTLTLTHVALLYVHLSWHNPGHLPPPSPSSCCKLETDRLLLPDTAQKNAKASWPRDKPKITLASCPNQKASTLCQSEIPPLSTSLLAKAYEPWPSAQVDKPNWRLIFTTNHSHTSHNSWHCGGTKGPDTAELPLSWTSPHAPAPSLSLLLASHCPTTT